VRQSGSHYAEKKDAEHHASETGRTSAAGREVEDAPEDEGHHAQEGKWKVGKTRSDKDPDQKTHGQHGQGPD